jgi:Skp family chaperone for outer membrane proteins
MKTTLFVVLSALLPGIFLMQANGGPTVAVIDFERAVSEASGGKDAITKITTFQNEQLAAITSKQKEAADFENRLRVQSRAMAVRAYAAEHGVKIVLDASTLQNSLVYVNDTADITSEIIRGIAMDLQNPTQQDASLRSERLLNRKWLEFSLAN